MNVQQKITETLPLYLSNYKDYKTMDLAIKLTVQNLRHIQRALNRLRERDGLGGVEEHEDYMEPSFPNILLLILYRIAEF